MLIVKSAWPVAAAVHIKTKKNRFIGGTSIRRGIEMADSHR
jgi:hypothetical protein